jgi:hypothetical protein
MTPRRHLCLPRLARAAAALSLLCGAAAAHAQLRLPSLNLPLPERVGPLDTRLVREPAERLLDRRALPDLLTERLDQVGRLLRQHPDALEADPQGEPVVRHEILAWSPTPAALAAAAGAGLAVVRRQELGELGETLVVLRAPDGASTAAMLARLRALDPTGSYDFNHVYTGSGALDAAAQPSPAANIAAGTVHAARVGLVDSGVDTGHPVFREERIERWGCDGTAHPAPHGTAVAALMVGQSEPFRGVAPGAALFAADIYCDSPTGGSAERIAGALGWLAQHKVAVINISLVGPANRLLERLVGTLVARGYLLVAAVGNDGPAAPPLYPASYPGVVGVSAVGRDGRVLPEAARGPQVLFAAPGNQMVSASPGKPPYRQVRGTSFAAPIVAALLAGELATPGPAAAQQAVAALARQAQRADAATVSNATGYGVVGAAFRIDPSRLR